MRCASNEIKNQPLLKGLILSGLLGVFLLHSGFSISSEVWPLLIMLGIFYFVISFCFISVGLAIMAIAMMFSPEISVGTVSYRVVALRVEDFLIPVLMMAWVAKNAIHNSGVLIIPSPLNKPIAALLVVMGISTGFGFFRGDVQLLTAIFFSGKIAEYFVIFFLTLNYIKTQREIRFFLIFLLLTVAALVLYTLPQVPMTSMISHRLSSPFEANAQPATVGGYLSFSFFIVFSIMLYQKETARKIVMAVFSVLIFIPILFTFSRSAYLMFIMGFILIAVLSDIRWLRLTVFFLLLASPVIAPRQVKERVAFTWLDGKNYGRTMGVDMSTQERISSFDRAFQALKINPLLGLGMSSWDYVDNQYSRTLGELGVLGLGLWLYIFWRLYKLSRWVFFVSEGSMKGLALGYSAGVFGLLFHAWGSCTFYVVRIMEPFWFMSGLIVALYLFKLRQWNTVHHMEQGV